MKTLNSQDFRDILLVVAGKIEENQDYLSELDGEIGDGDHGVSMTLGWRHVKEELNEMDVTQAVNVPLQVTGMTLISSVGAAMGPLYGSGFLEAGKVLTGKMEIDEADLAEALLAFRDGVVKRGQAKVGDKTMVDTIDPFVETFSRSLKKGQGLSDAVAESKRAGHAGMVSTIDLVAKIGRASRLGERTRGHQDAGATSAYIVLSTILDEALVRFEGR